jgi:hypothetical protein
MHTYKRISTNKTDRHDLTELLLNVIFKTTKQTNKQTIWQIALNKKNIKL